jgi:hypothetical protein
MNRMLSEMELIYLIVKILFYCIDMSMLNFTILTVYRLSRHLKFLNNVTLYILLNATKYIK